MALRDEEEYAIVHGRLTSNKGIDCSVDGYDDHLIEEHVAHSTALHTVVAGRGGCAMGPLARFNLNFDTLSPLAQEAAREAGLADACRNPFQSIIVRGVEILCLRGGPASDRRLRAAGRAGGSGGAPGRHRVRMHRGAPRHLLPPLHPGRVRRHHRREDRCADGRSIRRRSSGTCGGSSRIAWTCPTRT